MATMEQLLKPVFAPDKHYADPCYCHKRETDARWLGASVLFFAKKKRPQASARSLKKEFNHKVYRLRSASSPGHIPKKEGLSSPILTSAQRKSSPNKPSAMDRK